MNVDLPSLAVISSLGNSFEYPRSICLNSTHIFRFWFWLDIPDLLYANLPDSFHNIICFTVYSLFTFQVLQLDTSKLLLLPRHTFSHIQSISSSVLTISLPEWTCNDVDYTIFDFSRFVKAYLIEIGDNSFCSVKTFIIDGLNQLKTLKIGKNSFTQQKDCDYKTKIINNESKSFHILNCESLESIQIDQYSFTDFGGEFELKNLPQLQSIQIGRIGEIEEQNPKGLIQYVEDNKSYNFYYSSFVIRGIDLILNIEWLDLPNLQSITLGHFAFENTLSTIIESIEWIRMKWFE